MAFNFGSMLGSALGSLFGGDSNSALESYKYSKLLQKHQYKLDRLARQNSYGDTRISLERAGYNPLLAVGQQSNGGTYGANLSVQDPKSENLQNALSQISTMSGVHLNSAQANLNNKNAFATVINALNNTNQTNAQVGLINSQAQGQQLNNMITNATGMQTAMATLNNIKANTNNTKAQTQLNNAQVKVAKASAQLLGNQAQQVIYQNQSAAAQAQWYKNHPRAAQSAQWIQNVVGPAVGSSAVAIGTGVGAGKLLPVRHKPVGFR